ncbi:TetR/AcrR family transcriptional regulator [Pontibacter sp. E15-1]|uniref:TetR/AcrR family transcriptional regulator n=1 Tax=Pontibacter sp. E15-1 TaxID=2919918 RepID=UPI001F5009E9|nr:TetR/AcrR family transcriptional regulator [Pontibacter sp. E15-1]MCJ8163837.1 TetR/AcrR family transcriptional regulator [Pontibacter sp. E15-1]
MTLLETILEETLSIFKAEGIEANSEEDLFRKLDIRKSTYHELFQNKAELVRQVVLFDIDRQKRALAQLLADAQNPVEEIMFLIRNGVTQMQNTHPLYLTDVQQHYPEAWALLQDYLDNYAQRLNAEVINRGILQGYFRKDINLQLVTKIILEQFYMMINPAVFPPERYNLSEVFRSIYLYYVRGICTEQGGKMAEEYFAQNNL